MEMTNKIIQQNTNLEVGEMQYATGRRAALSNLKEPLEDTVSGLAEAGMSVSQPTLEAVDSPAVTDEVFVTPGRGIDSNVTGSANSGSLTQSMKLRYEKDSSRDSDDEMDVQLSRTKRKTRLFSDGDDEEEIVARVTRSKRLNSGGDIVDLTSSDDHALSVTQYFDSDSSAGW